MRQAKRNPRQASIGAAPVPLTQFYWVGEIVSGDAVVSVSVRNLMTRDDFGGGAVPVDEIQITGQPSQVVAVKAADGSKHSLPISHIDDTSGTATVFWDVSSLDDGYDYYLISLGWDTGIRGNTGQWMSPFNYFFTASTA